MRCRFFALTQLLAPIFATIALAEVFYPHRVTEDLQLAPYSSAGHLEAHFGKKSFSGSASIALDRRLVFGAAHVIYNNGRWAGLVLFSPAYDSQYRPSLLDSSKVKIARGFRILDGYAANKLDDYFDYDFAVAYAGYGGDFGPALDVAGNAHALLTGSGGKLILGYPAYLDYYWENFSDYVPGYYYLHKTGKFSLAFQEDAGPWSYGPPYLVVDNVSTGPGNSGGPVLVDDGGEWKLAGILVSGSANSAGVYSVEQSARSMAAQLLDRVENGTAKEIATKRPVVLKDGSPTHRTMRFDFGRRLPWETVRVTLRMDVQASSTNEVQAFLRSPSGRSYPVSSANIDATADVLGVFASDGSDSGRWTLYARDAIAGNGSAVVNRAALTLTSRWP